ncbi:unnamed protein product [Ceratitis capitata]|uniref:(Mediterranean fruit fly) hypothetical protein n=1 Tax=Ceratitis capitata TaxID=7213 RepID=A0A811TZG9_CERCA|nr:unnamed protein product [Ceratitis capitata]
MPAVAHASQLHYMPQRNTSNTIHASLLSHSPHVIARNHNSSQWLQHQQQQQHKAVAVAATVTLAALSQCTPTAYQKRTVSAVAVLSSVLVETELHVGREGE